MIRTYRWSVLALLAPIAAAIAPTRSTAQSFPVTATDFSDSLATSRSMQRLATDVLRTYGDMDRERQMDNRFRLQAVAGQYGAAAKTLAELRALRASGDNAATTVPYEILAKARTLDVTASASAIPKAFRETMRSLDDKTAALAIRALAVNPGGMQNTLRGRIESVKGKSSLTQNEALALIRAYHAATAFAALAPHVDALVDEDDNRRYIIDKNIQVKTADNARVCVLVVRPRNATTSLPALLEFTIYNDTAAILREARRSASNGYIGVSGVTRGKGCSPGPAMPYVYESTDVPALIDWISTQPWSDGRVGMFGGSYSGFSAWSATKRMPKALKAIMVGAPVAPGIDVPMEGNIVWNFVYQWPFYTTNNKTLDDATYFDNNRWFNLNRNWYISGKSYRELDRIDGTPNPIFNEWTAHSSYDRYWQDMIPYRAEFAKINIPVLQTAGYFYGGPGAATYYLRQHYKYNPAAEHYLVIGPYDHVQAQRGVVSALGDTTSMLNTYETDQVARMDITAGLRYQWFDYVLRGKPRPAILQDRINYEVMGANVWKHAPSIESMSNATLRLHLTPRRVASPPAYALSRTSGPVTEGVSQAINLANRTDVDRVAPGGNALDIAVDTVDALQFVSEPLAEPTELSGLFSGHFEITSNKRDFDFIVTLYELTADGKYYQLPPFQSRASHVGDLTSRSLLTPGKRETLDFRSVRLVSRKLAAGSRIVMIMGVIKSAVMQINYGTGGDVNAESIADAATPVTVKWFANSYIDLPIRR